MSHSRACLIFAAAAGLIWAVAAGAASPSQPDGGLYIVELSQPAMVARGFDKRLMRSIDKGAATLSQARAEITANQDQFVGRVQAQFGKGSFLARRYVHLTNAVAMPLTPEAARSIRAWPEVKNVIANFNDRPLTDAGPAFIRADELWNGPSSNRGEGVVIGVIDTGINWDHDAFADIGGDGYNHSNPLGRQLGLCSQANVRCNDKLIGVYDFTDEGTQGRDQNGHGSHVASIAAGNVRSADLTAITTTVSNEVSGVAPHANIVSYKACNRGEEGSSGSCPFDALLAALDQAAADGVDVVNYSIGGDPRDPWSNNLDGQSFLNLRQAGIVASVAAGNDGPVDSSVTSPANAPWTLAVANLTHDRRYANVVENLAGGNVAPPGDLPGVGLTAAFGPARIVHARDFGNALCGTGTPELQPQCENHTGSSNPFAAGTFNGEIVVCDRGQYGRVEKGFNLRAAGAGGYILANTDAQGESIVGDDHCLPAVHLGFARGEELRSWLDAGGDDHSGSLSGQFRDLQPQYGNVVSSSSGRGPGQFVSGVLKPNIGAPGSSILGAGPNGSEPLFLSGTSMAAPHIAGAAALLLAEHPDWGVAQVESALQLSASLTGVRDSDGVTIALPNDVGSGTARVGDASQVGLYLRINNADFDAANPNFGGDPAELNLPGIESESCFGSCSFVRTVTDMAGGGDYAVSIDGMDGAVVTVSPASFTLASGASQTLEIAVDVSSSELTGTWLFGKVLLTPTTGNLAPAGLTLSIFADPGSLPSAVRISTSENRGFEDVPVGGLVAMPDARFSGLGLIPGSERETSLLEDPTRDNPYDDLSQVLFQSVTVPDGAAALIVESVPVDNRDLDLFVGRDLNGDNSASVAEELCRSTSSGALESCVLSAPAAGTYWIVLQNWASNQVSDVSRVSYAVVSDNLEGSNLTVVGPGTLPEFGTPFEMRVSWDNGEMGNAQRWYGAVQLGPSAGNLDGIGTIPVILNRRRVPGGTSDTLSFDREPLALRAGAPTEVHLTAWSGHDRMFIDVPESATELRVEQRGEAAVELYLIRGEEREDAPLVAAAPDLDQADASNQASTNSKTLVVNGGTLAPGRWYVVPVNRAAVEANILLDVAIESSPSARSSFLAGQWFNPARSGHGLDLHRATNGDGVQQLVLVWYTYDEAGAPTWFYAQGPLTDEGDVVSMDLRRFAWNGRSSSDTVVGHVTLTFEGNESLQFAWQLYGESGTEPMVPVVGNRACPQVNGQPANLTGLWFNPAEGGYGYTVISREDVEVAGMYLYDVFGNPSWIYAVQEPFGAGDISMLSYAGFCPRCEFSPIEGAGVGTLSRTFEAPDSVSFLVDVTGSSPAPLSWRTEATLVPLTDLQQCP